MRHRHFSRFLFIGILSSVLVIGILFWVLINYSSLISDSTSDGFKRIPKRYANHNNLVQAVHPDKTYSYWALCVWNPTKDSIIFERGVKPHDLKLGNTDIRPPGAALFNDCSPGICLKYITYIYDGKIGYVQNAAQLKQFLGPIDNLEEALLLAEVAEKVRVDSQNIQGGAYLIDAHGYHLKLMKHNLCPETKETIQLRIQKDSGIVNKTNLGVYDKGGGCTVI
jgi:hypothetical protein